MWRFQILDFPASNENLNIGVLDIDLCGPSAPRLFGVVNEQVFLFLEYLTEAGAYPQLPTQPIFFLIIS